MEKPSLEQDELVYENTEHQSLLLSSMKSMYDNQQLTDITLQIDDISFACHKNVLAATSPYFRAMFTSELRESKTANIKLHEVDSDSVRYIIEYAYTGSVTIHRTNAQNLLAAASLFQIVAIQEACAKFMETQLDATNCVGIHFFAGIHSCHDLSEKAKECIEKTYMDVYIGEEFLMLSSDNLRNVLASNELNVESEEVVYESLMRWINHDLNKRRHLLCELLPLIRFALLNSRYIQDHVLTNKLITSCATCQILLRNLKEFEINPDKYHGSHEFNVILRSGMIKPENCILFIGGIDQKSGRLPINCYNPLTRETYFLSNLHSNSSASSSYYDVEDPACIVTEDNLIFVAGGNYIYHESFLETFSDDSYDDYEEETVHKDFFQYDNDHNTWKPKAEMVFPKSNFALAAIDGFIYCFGGLTIKQTPTEIVERYDIAKNKWSYAGMMPDALVDLCTVVHNGLVYILGGRTGVGAHNSVMSYSPANNEWKPLAGMPTPRFKFGACVFDNEIYVAGGQIYSHRSHTINREALISVEIYSISENQWRLGPELPTNLYNVGLFLISGSLYAAGTTEYRRSLYRIYRYNVVFKLHLATKKWEQIETNLCDLRDFGCVVAKMQTRKLSQVFRPEVDT